MRRRFLAAAAAAALGLFVATPAEASFPGRNGVIVFVHDADIGTVATVGAVAPSGRGYRELVGESSLYGGLSFSPDGDGLAYFEGALPTSLHLANSRGADRREVPGPVLGEGSAWSPNGRELAFVRRERIVGVPYRGLGIVGVDGQGLRVLTADGRDRQPAFSSRGQIAFVRGGDLHVINGDGSGLRRLTNSPAVEASPDFSPDGQQLVFASRGRHAWGGSDIFTMSARGGPARRLLRSPSADHGPVWSPDGRKVAFAFEGALSGIGTVGVDGRGYRTIRRFRNQRPAGRFWFYRFFSSLAWQPRR